MPGALPRNVFDGKVTSERPTDIEVTEAGEKYGEAFSCKPWFSEHD
jgi:hypothetical protein